MAGGLQIAPLKLELSDSNRIMQLQLQNLSADPVLVNLEIKAWQQQNGKDI